MPEPLSSQSIACIIPFFNGSKYIALALDSVFSQTVPFAEVIVVDDGSRTDEAVFLDRLGDRYPIRIIHQANGGQGAARNRGAAEAKATFLAFLDQDDFYLPRHNEMLLAGIPKDDLRFGFVYGDASLVDEEGNFTDTRAIAHLNLASQHPKTNIVNMMSHDMMILPSCTLVSREVFESCGSFDPQFVGYEDDDLFLRIFRAGYSNHYCDKAVTAWRNHAHRASYSVKMARSRIAYFAKLVAMYPDVEERRLFYFRDCLAPRFVPITLAEAVRAVLDDRAKADYLQLYARMTQLVCAHPTAGLQLKARLRLFEYLFRHVPGVIWRYAIAVLGPLVALWGAIPLLKALLPRRVSTNIAAAYRMLPARARFFGPAQTSAQGLSDASPLNEREGRSLKSAQPRNALDSTASPATGETPSRCVYTVLLGRYEQLNEQEVAKQSGIRFICFTDDPMLRSQTWEIRLVEPAFAGDPVRSQRDLKLRPHIHLPEFDQSLYIDNSVILKEKPEKLFDAFLARRSLALPIHSFRKTVRDEFLALVQQQLDLPSRIYEQLDHYASTTPNPLEEQPYWSGLLLRDHRDSGTQKMSEIWLAHVLRYSRRDQLSINMACLLAKIAPAKIEIDNHESWCHSWPHAIGRRQDIRIVAAGGDAALNPAMRPASSPSIPSDQSPVAHDAAPHTISIASG